MIYHADLDPPHPPIPQHCYLKHISSLTFWDVGDHFCNELYVKEALVLTTVQRSSAILLF